MQRKHVYINEIQKEKTKNNTFGDIDIALQVIDVEAPEETGYEVK